MAPQVLSNVVTYTVVLKTANPDGMLLPGMTVMANIVTQRTPAAMTVPMSALRFRPRTVVASSEPGSSDPPIRFGSCGTARPSCFRSSRERRTARRPLCPRSTFVQPMSSSWARTKQNRRAQPAISDVDRTAPGRALLLAGTERGAGSAFDFADDLSRRVRRHPRPLRLRKIDPDESDGPA